MSATETPPFTSSKLNSERGVLASHCNKATPGYAHGVATGTQATAANFRSGAPSTKQNAIEKMLLDVRHSITRSLVLESTSMEASSPGIEQRLTAAAASGLIPSMASDGHRWKVSRKPSSDVNRSISFVASINLSGDFPVVTRCMLFFPFALDKVPNHSTPTSRPAATRDIRSNTGIKQTGFKCPAPPKVGLHPAATNPLLTQASHRHSL